MTTEELIKAGLPVDPVVEGADHAAPTEDAGVGDSPRGPLKRRGNPHLNPGVETR
jgi:hypothetical protein